MQKGSAGARLSKLVGLTVVPVKTASGRTGPLHAPFVKKLAGAGTSAGAAGPAGAAGSVGLTGVPVCAPPATGVPPDMPAGASGAPPF
ncbi:MAG TPA: hypothetical protein VMG12_13835 [Polyangiaceae bacterium]|nr:hypothetical protein [Polyangiaceae bacterium]